MKFYTYGNSSAAYRVRIAMNLKGIKPAMETVHLLKDGGQQHSAAYKAMNPQELVPALEVDGRVLGQSLAIIEYLDETHPEPRVMPKDPLSRARVRQLSYVVMAEMHPLNNLSVRQYLKSGMGHSDAEIAVWYEHFIHRGFRALEALLAGSPDTGRFCHGDTPTMADCCLIPQVYNARRYRIALDAYPTILRIDAEALKLKAFSDAAPENFPDAA